MALCPPFASPWALSIFVCAYALSSLGVQLICVLEQSQLFTGLYLIFYHCMIMSASVELLPGRLCLHLSKLSLAAYCR